MKRNEPLTPRSPMSPSKVTLPGDPASRAKPKKYRKTTLIVLGAAMTGLIVWSLSDDTPPPDERRCVDPMNRKVVQEYFCEDDETSRRYAPTYAAEGSSVHYWYFGGSGYNVGDTASEGSRTPPKGYVARSVSHSGSGFSRTSSSSRSSSSVRGGFGSSASAHAAGGS